MSNMSQLPFDILDQIMDRLILPNLIQFGCVCTSWRSASAPARHKGLLPWLIVPIKNNSNNKETGNIWVDGNLGFYSILNKKLYMLNVLEIEDRRICGSSNGWLITVHENSDILLIHPFTREIIDLPSLVDFPGVHGIDFAEDMQLEYTVSNYNSSNPNRHRQSSVYARDRYIGKVVVSTRDKASLVVMVIAGPMRELYFWRPEIKGNTWIPVQGLGFNFYDLTYYNGKFYALNIHGNVYVVEGLDSRNPYTEAVIENGDDDQYSCFSYLIESSGDLLKFVRFVDGKEPSKTILFKVFKLDFKEKEWLKVETLGDRALFVGLNYSFSVCTSDFPGCKRNCVYYTDDGRGLFIKGYNEGIYNLEDGTIEKLYSDDSQDILPLPIWYAP
ncbi:hypothetical protein AQUCO_01400561v1 [Aquilegia coerulea]|uniref:F-box domain-containing protein n=1 Tax=Aquilegia coerulea TaxID=218851 RepID=A0A2G5DX23_AQUCA|nr:hypothetical protein AQUCO_01400561v1 [Aquilegia coerulea]